MWIDLLQQQSSTTQCISMCIRNLSKSSIFSEIYTVPHFHSYTYSRSAIYSITQLGLVNAVKLLAFNNQLQDIWEGYIIHRSLYTINFIFCIYIYSPDWGILQLVYTCDWNHSYLYTLLYSYTYSIAINIFSIFDTKM